LIDISIVILALNESIFIRGILDNVLEQDGLVKEIIVADAGSTDGTLAIVNEFQQMHNNVRVFNNTERYVSKALNAVVPECKGQYIAILGAHAIYPPHYIQTAVSFLQQHPEYSIVGGPLDHDATSVTGKSIAYCMSSLFGMGDSTFRTQHDDQETDTAPFPVYRKDVFTQLNGYDNRLIRNQDEDFHYRAVQKGFRIFMLSQLKSTYFVRESYKELIRQFFYYGYFKPLVMKKNKQSVKLRHLVPLFFVLYLLMAIALLITNTVNPLIVVFPLMFYAVIDIIFSFPLKNTNPVILLLNVMTFPLMHISYGTGTLFGLFKSNR
jgi:glycosyltransferase involved in cell wall biosynthesis